MPVHAGVGVSGVYFSFNGGQSWTQPTYSGWSARDCLGPAACAPHAGPIGTLPHYFENGLVSDGDPGVAFGPRPGANGTFSWANGSRLYYSNLTSNFGTTKRDETFKGFEAIAVSRDRQSAGRRRRERVGLDEPGADLQAELDDVLRQGADLGGQRLRAARSSATSTSAGRASAAMSKGNALPVPLIVARSADGGSTWTQKQVGPATSNGINSQPDGCTVRTDSHGNVYVFGVGSPGRRVVRDDVQVHRRRRALHRPVASRPPPSTPGSSTRSSAAR